MNWCFPNAFEKPRFGQLGSGLYGELRNGEGEVLWRSASALGLEIPEGLTPASGNQVFAREELADGTPLLTLSLAVEWEFDDGSLKSYVFKVPKAWIPITRRLQSFAVSYSAWFAAVALTMLLAFSFLLRG